MASPEALADGEAAGHMDVKKAGNPDFTGVSGLLRIAPDSILVEPGGGSTRNIISNKINGLAHRL